MKAPSWFKRKKSQSKAPRARRDDLDSVWMVVFNTGHQYGPFTAAEIVDLVEHRALAVSASVCRADDPASLRLLSDMIPVLVASMMSDRRNGQPRAQCRAAVTLRVNDIQNGVPAQCIDVSLGGLFLETEPSLLKVGQEVSVTINSGDFSRPIIEMARVVRRADTNGYALQFAVPSPQTLETLSQYIDGADASRIMTDASLLNAG